MAITLKLTFPAGRYHATPWGRHVNEGVPEWPPSPWRLLRALVAVWRRTCPDDLSEAQLRRILEALVEPPHFRLPPFRVAHTRHAMPMNILQRYYVPSQEERKKKFQGDPSIIFDTFVVIDRENPVFVSWPKSRLEDGDREVFKKLLGNLTSLGRAESWVHAELWEGDAVCDLTPGVDDPMSVLCADPATAFGDEYYPTHDPKKLKKGLGPDDLLFDCPRWHLCLDTQTIHKERWSQVPGSRWVSYNRPAEPKLPASPPISPRPAATFARFALDGPVLPLVTETLPLAERMRKVLLGHCKWVEDKSGRPLAPDVLAGRYCALWGKDAGNRPLKDHRHAFFLPADEDGDGRIEHVAVFASGGFLPQEVRALDRLRSLRFGDLDLSLALVGLGAPHDFARSRLLGSSTSWESATPFLVTRHLKRRGLRRDPHEWAQGPAGQALFVREVLREELARRGFLGAEVESLDACVNGARRLLPHEFRLGREKRGDDGARRPRAAFRLRFPEPVPGPIVLGHSSHFGLGLFLGAPDTRAH